MRILTERFNHAAVQFVSAQQNGFVPGGFIVENILLMQLLQAFAEEEDIEAVFIFLDFEKAFDRCSWEYLSEAIRNLGFPDEAEAPMPGDAEAEEGVHLRVARPDTLENGLTVFLQRVTAFCLSALSRSSQWVALQP